MSTLFRPLSLYEEVPPTSWDKVGQYRPGSAPAGSWPTPWGCAAQTSRAGEPLVFDQWTVAWDVPLHDAGDPDSLLVGADVVVANGVDNRALWTRGGQPIGSLARTAGTSFLDVGGQRLLTSGAGGGVDTTTVHDARRDASILLAFPEATVTKVIVDGPGALVVVTTESPPHGDPRTIVETVRVTDYSRKGETGILYGIEPLAGLLREGDANIRAAAAPTGPVLATRDGLLWCDWQLRPLHEFLGEGRPIQLAVDDQGRAVLLISDGGDIHLQIIPPGGPVIADLPLEGGALAFGAPVIAPDGRIIVASHDSVVALSPAGQILWQQARASVAPGAVTSNGLVLLCDEELYAVTPDGHRLPLWQPPAPLVTAAVLAGGELHVATADRLFVLRPSML